MAITQCTIKGAVCSAEIGELGIAEVVILELKLNRLLQVYREVRI